MSSPHNDWLRFVELPDPDKALQKEIGSPGPLVNPVRKVEGCAFCNPDRIEDISMFFSMGEPVMVFPPLFPVTKGHKLIVPMTHVDNALDDPGLTAKVMQVAAVVGRETKAPGLNIITSVGSAATQSINHFHVHLVPRHYDDGLPLPWTPQQEG